MPATRIAIFTRRYGWCHTSKGKERCLPVFLGIRSLGRCYWSWSTVGWGICVLGCRCCRSISEIEVNLIIVFLILLVVHMIVSCATIFGGLSRVVEGRVIAVCSWGRWRSCRLICCGRLRGLVVIVAASKVRIGLGEGREKGRLVKAVVQIGEEVVLEVLGLGHLD